MKITNHAKSLPLPPGDLGLPLIGMDKTFLQNPQHFREELYQKYGAISKTRLRGKNYIYLYGYEAVKFVLINEDKYFVNTSFPNSKKIFGNTNIGMLRGEEHKNRRQLLAKALKNKALNGYINTIQDLTQNYFTRWIQSEVSDLSAQLNYYSLDLFLKLLLGIDSGSQTEINNYLRTMGSGLIAIPLPLPWTKFGQALDRKKILFAEFETIINQRQQENNRGSDILGVLLEVQKQTGNNLSSRELAEQIVNLLLLGRNELTSALTSFLMLTIQYPSVLESLKIEQEQLDKSEPLSLEKLKKMVYLEQVIKEVLRQAPPVSGGLRQVIQDCSFQEWRIPQGWNVVYQITSVLEDPDIYEQPEKFNPERFNPINAEDKKKPFCYLPFGGGVRECIGKEFAFLVIKIFVSILINNYSWKFKQNQNLTINKFPVSRPASKVAICFSKQT
ncbi:MAG: cytochrome P450 [Xenococcaceae cyanobacterium MO_188.B19]|nr:cytochrome P450 [Xenococcaceae cyanobacterium MO_188.B19]